jgi:signal transduction histidine kinase
MSESMPPGSRRDQETVEQYRIRRLLLPTALLALFVAVTVVIYVTHAVREAERKSLREVTQTLSLLVSDPILTGDRLEVLKRISTVATHSHLRIEVRDTAGVEVATYPLRTQQQPSNQAFFEFDVRSTDGRVLGFIRARRLSTVRSFDAEVLFVIILLICFALIVWWLITGIRPVFQDLSTLGSLHNLGRDIGEIANGHIFDGFRFAETVGVYKTLLAQSGKLIAQERERVAWDTASQVAHDIRSPLAALEVASADISQLPEDKRVLIRTAIGRIHDIANCLLERHRVPAGNSATSAGETVSPQVLTSLIEPVISEKRLQLDLRPRILIELRLDASYAPFAAVQPTEFKRMISNLLGNAVEAQEEDSGAVIVGLSSSNGEVILKVQDNGKGIPSNVLARLGRRGETHGKAGGSGLGLFHARTCAESWGGRLDIASEPGKGTTVTVTLPLAPAPDWFVPALTLNPGRAIVVLDDDASIHQVWRGRLGAFKAKGKGVEVVHASLPQELRDWVQADAGKAREALYLLDYELAGHAETGLSLAEELGIGERTILVTSRYEESAVLEGCRRIKARLIPKALAGFVPISGEALASDDAKREHWDAILIDDDALVRATWKIAAGKAGKSFRAFSAPSDFMSESGAIDRTTPVYIDSDLGKNVKGEAEALKIYELGFSEIYLATGHASETFAGLAHLRGVIGKEPPWA